MKTISDKWLTRFILSVFSVLFMLSFAFAQEATYDKAVQAYLKKDFKTAVKYFKEYVEKKPDPYAYYLMGYALYKMKRHSESAKYFQEAYTIDPTISPKSVKELLKKKC